jgi:hypothetical protein
MSIEDKIKIAEKQVFYTEEEIYAIRRRGGRNTDIPQDVIDKLISEYHFLIELLKSK